MILFGIPSTLLLIAAIIAAVMAKGDRKRGLKIFALTLLGLLVIGAGICALIVSNLNFH